MDHKTIFIILANLFLQMSLDTIEIERWKEFTIWHRFNTVFVSAYTCKKFNVRIPWSNILVTDRPVNSVTISRGRCKFVRTPSLTRPTPNKGFSTYLITPYPVEWLLLNIRMILVLYKEVHVVFGKSSRSCDERIFFPELVSDLTTMLKFPRV